MNKPSVNAECKIIIGMAGFFFGFVAMGIPMVGQYLIYYGPNWLLHPTHAGELGPGTMVFLALCFFIAIMSSAACWVSICDET